MGSITGAVGGRHLLLADPPDELRLAGRPWPAAPAPPLALDLLSPLAPEAAHRRVSIACRCRFPFNIGMTHLALLLPLLLATITAGCGYGFKPAPGSRFAEEGVRFDLRPFENKSLIPDAGAFVAGRVREELRRLGFRGTFDRSGADYQVGGKVREIREDVITHDAAGFGLEYRLTLIVDIRVVEVTKGRLIWKEEGLTEATSFYGGSDYQYTESNRRAAFEEASRRMARRIGQTIRIAL